MLQRPQTRDQRCVRLVTGRQQLRAAHQMTGLHGRGPQRIQLFNQTTGQRLRLRLQTNAHLNQLEVTVVTTIPFCDEVTARPHVSVRRITSKTRDAARELMLADALALAAAS